MISEELVVRVAQAFARAEGFYETDSAKIPTVPQRACNPGDITDLRVSGQLRDIYTMPGNLQFAECGKGAVVWQRKYQSGVGPGGILHPGEMQVHNTEGLKLMWFHVR
jgi:hypothetical protein